MTYLPDNRVKWLVIHYSATPIEHNVSARAIDIMHQERGFNEIGYHFYIRKDGFVEKGRDTDQPGRFEMGAHSQGENDASIGVCYEGGVTLAEPHIGRDTRTPEQIAAMVKLIDDLHTRFPNARVMGHRDMPGAATQCPGFDASAWWDDVMSDRVIAREAKPKKTNLFAKLFELVMEVLF